ncbi:dUTP diphosphatase [bacterium]|nr:dUTP diphosphatase [bacterium]
MDVKIKLNKQASLPVRGSAQSAGWDLCSSEMTVVYPGETQVVQTGVSAEIPEGYEAQIRGRSGLAKRSINVALGTIDSDYRGGWGVILTNNSKTAFDVNIGDRIAQAVFAPVLAFRLRVVGALNDTERGSSGFGSTGTGRDVGYG